MQNFKMENHKIEKDISIFYVNAESFPDGILDAFEKLHIHFPFSSERRFFGLSRQENGKEIVYKAAAEVKSQDEVQKYKFDTMIIPKGNYLAETIYNFKENIPLMGTTFDELLKQPNLHPGAYCVEWYLPNDEDVVCLIRLED